MIIKPPQQPFFSFLFQKGLCIVKASWGALLLMLFMCPPIVTKAQSLEKEITVQVPKSKLEDAIRQVERESKMSFAYESTMLQGFTVPKSHFKGKKLAFVLTALLQGTGLDFIERSNTIIIKKKTGKDEEKPAPPVRATSGTLSGYVEDALSKERLVGVSIYVYGSKTGTTTNNYGFYSIHLPYEEVRVRLSYIGFKTIDTTLKAGEDIRLTFSMQPDDNMLNDVVITASKVVEIQNSVQMSKMTLSREQIESMPKFFGESDVMKTLQLMPGVQQGSEGTAALIVRGGSVDQNLILLDGSTLYNPSHLLGIFSTINTSTVKNVDIYKGAFPARFGGRLSSVVDIVTKDGNLNRLHGDFSIGLLASQLTLEGPIIKEKTSFVLSGRRTYGDLIATPIIKANVEGLDKFALYFYDLNLKAQHVFSESDRIVFSLYAGKDKLQVRNKENTMTQKHMTNMSLGWGNYNGVLRWNHVFSKNLFSNFTLMGSDYTFNTDFVTENNSDNKVTRQSYELKSGIRDYGAKADFDYRPRPDHSIRMGASYTLHTFTPGVSKSQLDEDGQPVSVARSDNEEIQSSEVDLYAEDDWSPIDKLRINYGLHWSGLATEGKFYNYLQPRASVRYLLPGDWGLKGSYTRMAQYIHLLSSNSITLPTDLWVPATQKVKPQLANQYAIGLARSIFRNTVELSIEGYYKEMDNVIEYKEGESYSSTANRNWSEKVLAGTGKAYGCEVMVQKKEGRLTGWIAYTLSKTERKIEGIDFGRTFPYKYDRRHDFKIVAVYKLHPGIEVSGTWVYQSAAPFTIPAGQYEGVTGYDEYGDPEDAVPNITSRNNVRLEPYHRLDLGLNFIKTKKNGSVRTWNISVFNVYNRKNPFFYYPSFNGPTSNNEMTRVTLLPLLPSISYNLKF